MENCVDNKVMIVDDENGIRELFKKILSFDLPDCEVDLAANGEEAVANFAQNHAKVIMMDLSMPVMDGETAFNRIMSLCDEKDWQKPSVIFCTGFAPPNTVQDIVEDSDDHELLAKPVGREIIVNTIKEHL